MNKFLIGFLFLFSSLFGAGQVTHAYLAKRFFEEYPKYNELEKKEFMVGTLFPDIRYLANLSREGTHYDQMSIEEVLQEESPFMAGVKYHSYVDIIRLDYVRSNDAYHQFIDYPYDQLPTFIKFMEDEIIFELEDYNYCIGCVEEILSQEREFGISEKVLEKWHQFLRASLHYPPSILVKEFLMKNDEFFPVSDEELQYWILEIKSGSESEDFQEYFYNMLWCCFLKNPQS